MKLIKTTKDMRDLYEKHLNKFYAHVEDGKAWDDTCYMCEAANAHPKAEPKESIFIGDCEFCPLVSGVICSGYSRRLNLVNRLGNPTVFYLKATPESILKHARWIEKQITEKTDCEFDTIKPRRK